MNEMKNLLTAVRSGLCSLTPEGINFLVDQYDAAVLEGAEKIHARYVVVNSMIDRIWRLVNSPGFVPGPSAIEEIRKILQTV